MGEEKQRPNEIELGGRKFREVQEGTVEQDLKFAGLISRTGIDEVVRETEEAPEEFARRLLAKVLESGEVLELLGCLLVPVDLIGEDQEAGDVWTGEIATATRDFLAGLRSAEDKMRVRSLVIQLLLAFFERGIVSLWTSRPSWADPQNNEKGKSSETERNDPNPNAVAGGGPGPTSSSSSPAETSSGPSSLSDGPSERLS